MEVLLRYAASDRDVATDLASRLAEAGHRVWFSDNELFPGDNIIAHM